MQCRLSQYARATVGVNTRMRTLQLFDRPKSLGMNLIGTTASCPTLKAGQWEGKKQMSAYRFGALQTLTPMMCNVIQVQ